MRPGERVHAAGRQQRQQPAAARPGGAHCAVLQAPDAPAPQPGRLFIHAGRPVARSAAFGRQRRRPGQYDVRTAAAAAAITIDGAMIGMSSLQMIG